jgi:hypothetical protein
VTDDHDPVPPRRIVVPSETVDTSPVLAMDARIEREAGRWVVYLDVVLLPDTEPPVVTRRLGDYPSAERARLVAAWVMRTAHRTAPPSHGF